MTWQSHVDIWVGT